MLYLLEAERGGLSGASEILRSQTAQGLDVVLLNWTEGGGVRSDTVSTHSMKAAAPCSVLPKDFLQGTTAF